MKRKLWIAWGVMGILSLFAMGMEEKDISYVCAFIAAGFGWVAFFKFS